MPQWDETTDVVAIGTGTAGLGAALTAKANGLEVIVLEAAALVGGSSMLAGGGMWIPANRFMLADGDHDSAEIALEYMQSLIGDLPPASTRARKEAFVRNAPLMVEFLESQGMRFRRTSGGYPDYYPDVSGASTAGRGIESVIFDSAALGEWADKLPPRRFPRSLPMGTLDVAKILLAKRTPSGFARLARIYAHHYYSRVRGQRLVGGGGALVAQLLLQTLNRGIPVRLQTRVKELGRRERPGRRCRHGGRHRRDPADRGDGGGARRRGRLRPQCRTAQQVPAPPDHRHLDLGPRGRPRRRPHARPVGRWPRPR